MVPDAAAAADTVVSENMDCAGDVLPVVPVPPVPPAAPVMQVVPVVARI